MLETIVVVEDEIIVAIDLQTTLENLGYRVLAIADTGRLAIKKVIEVQPNLVLMDIRLKGDMDGITAAEEIYSRFDVPIIYLTAYADEDTLNRAKLTSPYGYIVKPFGERELRSTIEITLYKHRMERQLKEKSQWLATVLKSIGDGVITNDINARITFMNPIAEALTGWQQADALGKNLSEVFPIVHETNRTAIASPIIEAIEEGNIVRLPEQTLLLSRDGTEIPIGDSAAPIKDEKENVIGAVLVFWDMTEQRQAKEQLRHQAFHDALTGLPNRLLFIDRLSHAIERAKRYPEYRFAVLFLDLDRFKVVNDSLGHPIGDQLLVTIASRLETCLRAMDTVARLGGDEFAILIEDIQDVGDACRAARRILRELSSPLNLGNHQVFTTASIGIVLSSTDYDQAEDLLRNADIAMYRAKMLGKARYEVFDAVMHAQATALLQLENDLRRAIDCNEFQVYYQPIISLSTNQLMGFEALVRWQHPQQGTILPGEFIPVAEETGLIVEIDRSVLREACKQTRRWQQSGVNYQGLAISVNLSSKNFTQPNFVEEVLQILAETNLAPGSLKLEITETVIIENPESAITILSRLRALGIGLSIDDFGTGYSSLNYLHRFPFDIMKIDRSFISRIDREAESLEIVRTIVILARNFGMAVIAEGVETLEQLVKLQELQCEYAQGYFFDQPLDSRAAELLIVSRDDMIGE